MVRALSLRAGVLIVAFGVFAVAANADDGVYVQDFDPVQSAQVDAALSAIEKYGLDRVLLVPNPDPSCCKESLETRHQLLTLAAAKSPRLVVPPLARIKKMANQDGRTKWYDFWMDNLPKTGKLRPLLQSSIDNPNLPGALEGTSIFVVSKQRPAPRGRHFVKVTTSPNQTARFQSEPAMNEGLLTAEVAEFIRSRRLYGHSGLRGYYGLPRWLTLQLEREQKLNDRIEDKTVFDSINQSDLPSKYYPEQRPTFRLFHVDVPVEEAMAIKTGPFSAILDVIDGGKRMRRFFIHPHSRKLFEKSLGAYRWHETFWATPTSSHRSLIVWNPNNNEEPFGIKTTLDATIGGSLRHLTRGQVERASVMSALINAMSKYESEDLRKIGVQFVDEPVGVYLKDKEVGYALRSLLKPAEGAELMPMFSAYSKPPGAAPPIVEMIRRSGLRPREFVEEQIIKRVIEQYMTLAFKHGAICEPHEQNLVMEVKDGLPTGRIFYRDLAGFSINPELRTAQGKSMAFMPNGIRADSLRPEWARPIENALDYLLHANFFALTKAVKPYFNEVSATWVEATFRKQVSQNMIRFTGKDVKTIPEWKNAYKEAVNGARCSALFLKAEGL